MVDDPLALVPEPIAAVTHLSAHLAAFGETVKAGDVLITGSIVPALAIAPGDRVSYRLEPLGGAHARRLGAVSPGYTPRALAPMAELVDAPG